VILILRKPRELRPGIEIDGAYATSIEDKKSVSGMLSTLGGMITNHFAKTQSIVTLSSTEMEYLVFTPAVQELLFMLMLLDEWNAAVRPAFVLEDNTAAIYLVRNQHVGQRTKHIDIRYHHMRQHYPHNFIAMYINTDDNDADQMTKHQPVDLFERHSNNIQGGSLYIYNKWWDLVSEYNDGSYLLRHKKMKKCK